MSLYGWHDNDLVVDDLEVHGTLIFGDAATDNLIVKGRLSSMTAAGAAIQIGASYLYGEGIEMRYQVTDWTGVGSSFKGMYIRAEAATNTAAGKSIYGAELYGVCNNVTMTTGSLWGTLTYAYVKGVDAVVINNMYAVQGELTWDASRTGDCTITTAAACFRAKITGGRVADYTKIHGYELTIGEMDGESQTFGSGIVMQDDSGMSGTSTLTTGLNLLIGCTTGISIAGVSTDAIKISGDATTAINITSGCTPTDGLKIAGACANAINITGVATTKGIVLTSQTTGLLQGTTTMTLSAANRNAVEINAISPANAAFELRGLYVTTYPSTAEQATSKMRGVYSEVQSTLNIDNMVAIYGYANMSAAKTIATGSAALHGDVNVDNATTLTAGRMVALWAQVRGDSALTGNLDCIYADAEMDIDNAIYVNVDTAKTATVGLNLAGAGTYTTGILIAGTVTNGIDLTEATLTQGIDNAMLSFGSYSAAKAVAVTDNYIPFQINLEASGNVAKTIAAEYLKVSNAVDTASLQLCGSQTRVALDFDVDSAYGVQSHIGIGTAMATGVSKANIAAGSFKIDLDANVTQGNVQAGLFIIEGSAAVTEGLYGIQISAEGGTPGSTPAIDSFIEVGGSGIAGALISAQNAAGLTNLFDFNAATGCIAAAGSTSGSLGAADGVATYVLKVDIGGTAYYIGLCNQNT